MRIYVISFPLPRSSVRWYIKSQENLKDFFFNLRKSFYDSKYTVLFLFLTLFIKDLLEVNLSYREI
jgi:hypothetical protein